jgi:hypothetical protein
MKKLLFLLLGVVLSFSSYAQLEVLDSAETVTYNNGDTLQLVAGTALYVKVHNTGTDTVEYICVAVKVVLQSGTDAFFNVCSNGVCATVTEPMQIGNSGTLAPDGVGEADVIYVPANADSNALVYVKFINRNNPDDTASVYFAYSPATELNKNLTENQKISVYPNPANEVLKVNYNVERLADIEILDLQGRNIQTINLKELHGTVFLNTAYLTDGVYVLKIGNEKRTFIVKH